MKTTVRSRTVSSPSRRRRPRSLHAASLATDAAHLILPESDELSDGELAELLRETFRGEVGSALDSVRIGCVNGVVFLSGVVGSDELVQVAMQIAADEMGLDVINRVAVSAFAAECGGYSPRPLYAGDFASELGLGSSGGVPLYAYDVYDGDGERYGYSPPDRPVAETD